MIDTQKNVAAIITLILGVSVAILVLLFTSTLGGSTYSLVENDIDSISEATISSTLYYNETFQPPDTNWTNPTEDWYTYSESGLDFMNVTNLTAGPAPGNSNQTFQMNMTGGETATGGALYHFENETTYDVFSVYVMINETHNYTIVTLGSWIEGYDVDAHGAIAYWNVTNDTVYFYVLTGDGPDYTEVYNESITQGVWHRLYATFDYEDYTISSKYYSIGIAGLPTLLSSGEHACPYAFQNITQTYWAMTAGSGANINGIWFDDFQLVDYVYVTDASQESIEVAIRDAVAGSFRGLSLTGSYLPLVVLAIVIVMILGIVLSMTLFTPSSKKSGGGAL